MKLSTRAHYAVMALADLAIFGQGSPLPLASIADRQALSLSYLEQLFACMRRANLVESIRGPGGGYTLARPMSKIFIAEIIVAVEEPLHATMCKPGGKPCRKDQSKCLSHDLWAELSQHILNFLSSVSLEHVVQGTVVGASKSFSTPVSQSTAAE